ncbi:thioredoxin-disulfide reductase, partial [Clavibacter michiganensis subsp. insidiosus]
LLDAASDGPDGPAGHGAPAAGSAVDPDGELVGAERP